MQKIDFFERPINRFVIAYLRFLSKFGTLSDQLFIDYRGRASRVAFARFARLTVRNGAKCATKPIPVKFGASTCYLSVRRPEFILKDLRSIIIFADDRLFFEIV